MLVCSPASVGMIARDCERARYVIASVISPDYRRYQGIDDNLLERSTLYSMNLQLKLTQAKPRSTGSAVFYKTPTPSSSLACLIFESSEANEILHSDKHSSPFKLLQPSSLQPRRCFLSRQLAAGAGIWLLPGNDPVFSSAANSGRSLQDRQGLNVFGHLSLRGPSCGFICSVTAHTDTKTGVRTQLNLL